MIDREACIVLNLSPGVGFVKYSALSREFGSPAGVFGRSSGELRRIPGIGEQLGERIASFDWEGSLNRETELAERAGVRIITLFDDAYPEVLRQLPDPPLCLYVRGRLPAFPDNAVAIVGSRRMSAYGERMTRSIAADAAAAGFTVVSGLAYGVDAIAHRTVVDAAGVTVAVLGGGLMNVHPRENIPLARAIVASGGAIISEFPLEFPVPVMRAPKNRKEKQYRMAGNEAAGIAWQLYAAACIEVLGFGPERLGRLREEARDNYRQVNGWAADGGMEYALTQLKRCAELALREKLRIVDEDPAGWDEWKAELRREEKLALRVRASEALAAPHAAPPADKQGEIFARCMAETLANGRTR